VGTVKGFGPAIVARLLAGIEAFRHREERVLLAVADRHAEQLLRFARSLAEVTNCSLAGALRRRTELVDAIDIVVETTSRTEAIAAFVRYPPIVEVTARTASSLSLRLADGVLVRATMATPGTFGAVLVEQTGSAAHVARLGRLAGPGGLQGADEAGVYGRLGLPCIPAELREDRGEIEAASAGRLPDLLVGADIRGLVHCHTVYSDGKHTIAQMAKAADALGMEYLTITDHSPSAHYANGVEPARLQEQWDEIARVQQQVKVLLLRGTESDILADGSLDYDEATLQRFDVVIASIHNRHKMDRVQMTRRLIAAMRNPFFKIWGHPLGRYVGSRPPIDCDVEAVLDAAAESRVAIEVNGDPHRLDLEPHWQRAARCRGLPFVISTDAHSTRQFGNLRYGVDMARRGWLCKDDVLNTRSAREFVDAVRPG
jgi:DNA polymerase (family 10)